MAVTTDKAAPYAPASAILDLIDRYRNRGLPSPITGEVLGRAGVSQSLIPRTLQALQTLDLIDDQGKPTEILEGIRLAPEPEYKQRLEVWLNAAYADVITFVDPATDDETKIRDAFRSYQPVGQQARMVTLFLGLYAAAGKAPERPAKTRPADKARTPRRQSAPPEKKGLSFVRKLHQTQNSPSGIPIPLSGLLSSLPPQGEGWTQERRDIFMKTFGAVLDYCYPIIEDEPEEETAAEDDPATV
jgi:hypothetical protein